MSRLTDLMRDSTAALEERDFRFFWLGQSGSAVGDALVGVALAFAVLELGGSASALGIVFAAYSIPRVLLTLAGGVWSDRLPRRRVMLAADLVRAGAQAVVAPLLITGNAELWHVVALAAVMGSASAFFQPASTGLMPQIVSRERLQQANALVSISQSAAHIFGPLLAGLIVATIGPGWAFAIDGGTFVFSAACLLAMRIPDRVAAERRAFVAELAEGWREVVSRTWVLACIITFSLSNASLGAFQILGPLIAERELGGAAAWGVILTGGAIGGLLGGAIALRWKPRRPLVPGFVLMALATVQLLALIPPLPVAAIAISSTVTFGAIVLSNAFWDTMLQQHIPAGALSRVSSYDWMLSLLLQPIAFAAVGPISEAVGISQTLALAAGIGIVANLGVLLVPGVRHLARRDERPPADGVLPPHTTGVEATDPPMSPPMP